MKSIAAVVILLTLSGMSVGEELLYQEHSYASLLLSGDGESIKVAAKSIYAENTGNSLLLDIAAQILWERSKKRFRPDSGIRYNTKSESDTLSWLAKAIGASKNMRYKNILEQSLENTDDEKLKKYIGLALNELKLVSEDVYVVGRISQEEIRKSLALSIEENRSKRSNMDIFSVKPTQSIREIYQLHGVPDRVSIGYRRVYRPSFYIYHPLLQAHYFNVGMVQFDSAETENNWVALHIFKEIDMKVDIEGYKDEGVVRALLINNGSIVREAAQDIYNKQLYDDIVLDVAIERMRRSHDSRDKEMIDGFTWLLKGIGMSGKAEYIHKLNELIVLFKKPGLSKLKKHASKAKKELEKRTR